MISARVENFNRTVSLPLVLCVLCHLIFLCSFLGEDAHDVTTENIPNRIRRRFVEINKGYRHAMRTIVRREGASLRRRDEASASVCVSRACALEEKATKEVQSVSLFPSLSCRAHIRARLLLFANARHLCPKLESNS